MYAYHKFMCGCECCRFSMGIHSSLLTRGYIHLEKIKDHSKNDQSRTYEKITSCIIETYNNAVMTHVSHI